MRYREEEAKQMLTANASPAHQPPAAADSSDAPSPQEAHEQTPTTNAAPPAPPGSFFTSELNDLDIGDAPSAIVTEHLDAFGLRGLFQIFCGPRVARTSLSG